MTETSSASIRITCETMITNARIITGDGSEMITGMVGVTGERIVYVGEARSFHSDRTIDAQQRILSPGFIDIHGHSDFSILLYPDAESKIAQGVTTEFIGNCGLSAAPLYGDAWWRWHGRWKKKNLNVDWQESVDYFERVEEKKCGINIAPLLGHGNLRAAIKNYTGESLTEPEKDDFERLTIESVEKGYWGISLGLAYPPGIFAARDELAILFQIAKQHNIPITVHMRDEGDMVEESVDEMLELAERYDTSLQISHLKAYGSKNWDKIDTIITKIDSVRKTSKSDIHFDRYPYRAFNTDLDFILPQELFDGGHENAVRKLRDASFRQHLAKYLNDKYTRADAENIIISSIIADRKNLIGKTLTEIFDLHDSDFWLNVIELISEVECEAEATFVLMREDNMPKIFKHPCAMIASDSSVRSYTDEGNPHPRTYGTFPRFLQMVVRDSLMPLEEAVYKITGLPALKFGLKERGMIKENCFADLVLWDPDQMTDFSSYTNSKIKPRGVCKVWINGREVYDEGKMSSHRAGRLLLKERK